MGADPADMQLISNLIKEFAFYYVLLIFSYYCLIDKKDISITNAFQKTLKQSNRKPNEIWVHRGSEFYNR